jgi:hypothetical protein
MVFVVRWLYFGICNLPFMCFYTNDLPISDKKFILLTAFKLIVDAVRTPV